LSASSPRIPPRPPDEWDDDAVAALRDAFGTDAADRLLSDDPATPPMPNVLATLLRHPALTGPFLTYNNVLLRTPTLEPRWRELIVLRVAWRTRSEYEWAQHVRMAARVDITADEVDAVAQGAEADSWSPLEADLLRATDELLDGSRIRDDTWARLEGTLDERQLIELTFVVGTYTCLAMVFNSIGLPLDRELGGVAPLPSP
jgi:4-carboxymuconolactone decarboxylase